jgi:tetratricopeptide (TPR) repeat protein
MEDAARFYTEAAELSPLDASPLVELGITLWAARRYPEALEACDRAIALAPDATWPYLTKAWVLWSWQGGVTEARAALEGANQDHPWAPWFWFWQEIYEEHYDAALEWLDRNPGEWIRLKMWIRPEVLLRAYVYDLRLEHDRAREAYEEAARMLEAEVTSEPDEPRLRSSLGIAYAALGRSEEAVREGRRATELFPLSADAAYALPHAYDLVHIHSLTGDLDTALSETERLLATPGWFSIPWLETDPRWAPISELPGFQALREEYGISRSAGR